MTRDVKPVISIDLQDEKFREFYKLFDSYQSKLEDMPAEWKKMQKALDSAAVSLGRHFKNAHIEGIEDGAKASVALAKHLGMAAKQQGAFARETTRANRAFHALTKESRNFMLEVTTGATALEGAFGAAGRAAAGFAGPLAAIAATLAAAVAAVDKLGSMTQGQRLSARSLGLSIGQERAFANVYQRVMPNPEGYLQAIQAAKMNPKEWAGFAWLGIRNPQKMSTLTLAEQVMQRTAAKAHTMPSWEMAQVAKSAGLNSIFSDIDLNRLRHTPLASLAGMPAEVARKAPGLNINAKAASALARSHSQIGYYGGEIETKAALAAAKSLEALTGASKGATASLGVFSQALAPGHPKAQHVIAQNLKNLAKAAHSGHLGSAVLDRMAHAGPVNNPGNLKFASGPLQGYFRAFPNMRAGWLAMARQLQIDEYTHGEKTLRQIVYGAHGWHGWTDTQRKAYLANLQKISGIPSDRTLNLRDKKTLARVMGAIAASEEPGRRTYPGMIEKNILGSGSTWENTPANMAATRALNLRPTKVTVAHAPIQVHVHNETAARVSISAAQAAGVQ